MWLLPAETALIKPSWDAFAELDWYPDGATLQELATSRDPRAKFLNVIYKGYKEAHPSPAIKKAEIVSAVFELNDDTASDPGTMLHGIALVPHLNSLSRNGKLVQITSAVIPPPGQTKERSRMEAREQFRRNQGRLMPTYY